MHRRSIDASCVDRQIDGQTDTYRQKDTERQADRHRGRNEQPEMETSSSSGISPVTIAHVSLYGSCLLFRRFDVQYPTLEIAGLVGSYIENSNFTHFFSFLKFNEFYEFEKNSQKIRNFANRRCLACFDVLECNVHL